MTHAFVVTCPACDTGFLLPRRLAGPHGARVTCPVCARVFDVDAAGAPMASPDAAPAAAAAPGTPAPEGERADARAVAGQVLDELAGRLGRSLAEAARDGRLFRAHGPEVVAAFDAFRLRAGEAAAPRVFREALRERWQVELLPPAGAHG